MARIGPATVVSNVEEAPTEPRSAPGLVAVGMRIHERYELRALLGKGGMANVYEAFDRQTGEDVAVKVLSLTTQDEELEARFRREMRIAMELQHPRLVRTFDVGEYEEHLFIVMELLRGETIRQRMDRKRGLAPDLREATRIGIEVAEGLAVIHQAGVMHRDIKPANLFLTGDEVKITDFGIARATQEARALTAPKAAPGTPCYLAPERVLGRPAAPPTDLWSLGVLLFEMATGALPFDERRLPKLLHAIVQQEAPPPRRLNPAVPLQYQRIVLDLLAKDPQRRPQTASEVARRLAKVF